MSSKRFLELDIVRGFATCWVVGIHFWLVRFLPTYYNFQDGDRYLDNYSEYLKFVGGPSWTLERLLLLPPISLDNVVLDSVNTFFLTGFQGVHLFFILSGFGLTYSMLAKPEQNWFAFIKNKFLRIYPTYWILLILCLLVPLLRYELFYGYFDTNGTFINIFRSFVILDAAIPFSWFMFPLIQFYLAFFPLFHYLQRTSVKRFLSTVFITKFLYTLGVLEISYYIYPPVQGDSAYPGYIAISRAFEFCLGMVFGKVYFENPQKFSAFITHPKIILLGVLSEFIGCLGSFQFSNNIQVFGHVIPLGISVYDAFIGFGVFVLIFNFSRFIHYFVKPLETILLIASKFSYEMYLAHFIALMVVAKLFLSDLPDESAISTLVRALLLYGLTLQICMICAVGLQWLTKLIVNKWEQIKPIYSVKYWLREKL